MPSHEEFCSFCTCRLLVSCLATSWLAPSCVCWDLCHCWDLFLVWLVVFIWDHHTAFKNQAKPAVILGKNVWILKFQIWETGNRAVFLEQLKRVHNTQILVIWLYARVLSHRHTEISSGRCVARSACCWILASDTVRSTGANQVTVTNVHFLNAVKHGELNCCKK